MRRGPPSSDEAGTRRVAMRVVRDDLGAVTIEGLTPSQFAFIVGVVGASNALLGRDGEISRKPMIPTARELYSELHRHASEHALLTHVDAVISSHERWKARQVERGSAPTANSLPPRACACDELGTTVRLRGADRVRRYGVARCSGRTPAHSASTSSLSPSSRPSALSPRRSR